MKTEAAMPPFCFKRSATNMETNFIALVPYFKFERRLTFVMTCDVVGLHWLRDSFLCLVDAELQNTFVIGDGTPIASDDRCRLAAVKVRDEQANEILPSYQSDFIWH